jgi:hypothetical protein
VTERDERLDTIIVRLTNIEVLLTQLLERKRAAKRNGRKRSLTMIERAARAAAKDTVFVPTELDMAAARRALNRRGRKP